VGTKNQGSLWGGPPGPRPGPRGSPWTRRFACSPRVLCDPAGRTGGSGADEGVCPTIAGSNAGTTSLQLLVVMVPVFFGFMGFALDLGRLYLIHGELNQAANAMALAAAAQLNGTVAATTAAQNALPAPVGSGPGFNYNFGALPVGVQNGDLNSTINPPAFFATLTDATATNGAQADGTTAQFAQVSLTADAPLLFWSLLPGGESRKTTIAAEATAGISAPLCTACNIVPLAVAAASSSDTVDFGFTQGTVYTLSYSCTGTPTPVNLVGTTGINGSATVPYVLINRFDPNNASLTESDQLYQDGAQGLVASNDATPNACTTNSNTPLACMNVGDCEQVWASATPGLCSAAANPSVEAALCGLYSRLDTAPPAACTTDVTDFGVLSAVYAPDTAPPQEANAYTAYTGNGRSIFTLAIVDALGANAAAAMTVLGFRQFLLEVNSDGTFFNPADPNGRFPAMYIGAPAPVQSGWFDTRFAAACPVGSFSGPGKVVLQQ
jgi:Putative Flp pilus-assembly TadE/G-like